MESKEYSENRNMKRTIHLRDNLKTGLLLVVLAPILGCLCHGGPSQVTYPPTRQTEQTDEYHGVKVADPFRWLEDDNSAETKAWVEAQNKVTFGWLDTISERKG